MTLTCVYCPNKIRSNEPFFQMKRSNTFAHEKCFLLTPVDLNPQEATQPQTGTPLTADDVLDLHEEVRRKNPFGIKVH